MDFITVCHAADDGRERFGSACPGGMAELSQGERMCIAQMQDYTCSWPRYVD
jgi:hypothetical protein